MTSSFCFVISSYNLAKNSWFSLIVSNVLLNSLFKITYFELYSLIAVDKEPSYVPDFAPSKGFFEPLIPAVDLDNDSETAIFKDCLLNASL